MSRRPRSTGVRWVRHLLESSFRVPESLEVSVGGGRVRIPRAFVRPGKGAGCDTGSRY